MFTNEWGYHRERVNNLFTLPRPKLQIGPQCSINATVTCLEARNNLKSAREEGRLPGFGLSVQWLLDGVSELSTDHGLSWIYRHGIAKDSDYFQYNGVKIAGRLNRVPWEKRLHIKGIGTLNPQFPHDIKEALDTKGPLIASFLAYRGDPRTGEQIYRGIPVVERDTPAAVAANPVGHAVTIIGYGITEEDEEYWVYQNSYGPNWGENGIGRIKQDLVVRPVFPILRGDDSRRRSSRHMFSAFTTGI